MSQTSNTLKQAQDEGRREALTWLARRLTWEHRLGELRPDPSIEAEAKQAA